MKNSLNLVLAVFAFIAIACSCPNLKDLDKKTDNDRPTISNTSNTSTSSEKDDSKSNLESINMANYNKIKTGMSYKEVVAIMGSEGEESFSSESGKFKVANYKWSGDNFSFIMITTMNGKVSSKSNFGLK
jgi:hypothetical protein